MTSNVLAKYKNSPAFSFRGNYNSLTAANNPEHLPSPNHYTPQKPIKNQVKIVFPKSLRKTFVDKTQEKSPGPGQYESSLSNNQSYLHSKYQGKNRTFTSRFSSKFQEKPGPGAYDIKKDLKKTLPSFSIRLRTKTFHQIQTLRNDFKQAPGAYDISSKQIGSTPAISMLKSPRFVDKEDSLPGPGKYETNENFFSQRSFSKKNLSRSERKISFQMRNSSPGPKYVFESSFEMNKRKQKGFSCRKRFGDTQNVKEIPGPGNYQTQSEISYRSIESCKMPKAQRNTLTIFNTHNLATPGPGTYENLTETYNALIFKSQSAPKFSKAKLQKISTVKMDTTDRFYDAKINIVKRRSSSYSIGADQRKNLFGKINNLPGPGEYDCRQFKAAKESSSGPKFPQSLRSNPILNKLPMGPGEYLNLQYSGAFKKIGTKFAKGQRKTEFSHLQNQNKSIMRISNSSNCNAFGSMIKR